MLSGFVLILSGAASESNTSGILIHPYSLFFYLEKARDVELFSPLILSSVRNQLKKQKSDFNIIIISVMILNFGYEIVCSLEKHTFRTNGTFIKEFYSEREERAFTI